MAIENLGQYLQAGNAQLTQLSGAELQNAEASLLAVSPFLPGYLPAQKKQVYTRSLAYFTVLPDGTPQLVIPPPAPAPLPTANEGIVPDPPEAQSRRASRGNPVPPGGIGAGTDSTGGLQPAPQYIPPGSGLRPASTPPAKSAPPPATTTTAPAASSPVVTSAGDTTAPPAATELASASPAASGPTPTTSTDCTSALTGSDTTTTPEQRTTEEQLSSALSAITPTIADTASSPCTANIQLACTMPVTPADVLVVDFVSGFWNSVLTSFTLPVQAKIVLCDGTIQTIATGANVPVVGPNDVTDGQITVPMPVGCLLNVSIGPGPYCCHPGEIWVHGYLAAGGAGGNIAADLCSGYVTDGSCVTWPGSGVQPWGQGHGNDNWFDATVASPTTFGFSPAQGTIIRLKQVTFVYKTAVTGLARGFALGFAALGSNTAVYFGSAVTQTVNTSYRWTFASGIPAGQAGVDRSGNTIVQVTIPPDLYTDFEGGLRIWIANGDNTNDAMSEASIYYESWMEPRSAPF